MAFHTILHEKRKALSLTQEQVAQTLGVTAPAVNKWERGVSYPDVALIPALARLLKTDLNTLLCFQDGLSEAEIRQFQSELTALIQREGFAAGLALVQAKVRDYPNCAKLIYECTMMLDGALVMLEGGAGGHPEEVDAIVTLYVRAADSDDAQIRANAAFLLASKYMLRAQYDKAQEMLNRVPERSAIDRQKLQADLFLLQGKTQQAAQMLERKLLQDANSLQGVLDSLAVISHKEGHARDADEIASLSGSLAKVLGQWDYWQCIVPLTLAFEREDVQGSLMQLEAIMSATLTPWDMEATPLYRHIAHDYPQRGTGMRILPSLLGALETDPKYDFLRDNSDFLRLIAQYREKTP